MPDNSFNKSVVKFPTAGDTIGRLRSINYKESTPKADVTGASDTTATFVAGIPVPELSMSFVGPLPAACLSGAKGALSVVWNDSADNGTLQNVQIVDRATSGQMNGETISTLTFAPCPA